MKTKRRPTIGGGVLDALLSPPKPITRPVPTKATAPASKPPRKPVKAAAEPRTSSSRFTKATYNVPEDLVEETRNAVRSLAGAPLHLTLAAFVEAAFRKELERLRKTHNGGDPFSGSGVALKGGRPLK